MEIDKDYMLKEINSFREIMCNKKYTVQQVSNALGGLLTAWTRFKPKDDEELTFLETMLQATTTEHDKRLAYRLVLNI